MESDPEFKDKIRQLIALAANVTVHRVQNIEFEYGKYALKFTYMT